MRGRPNLYTDYQKESSIFSNKTQKSWFGLLISLAIGLCFLATDYWLLLITTSCLIAIASWGLNIVSGLAGQINLAHGVFIGVGTYASAVIGGVATSSVIGYNLDMIFWLACSWFSVCSCRFNYCTNHCKTKGTQSSISDTCLGVYRISFIF